MARNEKKLLVRCWVDVGNVRFFGPGRAELLQLIDETGSISKAAKAMKMSYKKAWDMVDQMNTHGQRPYVISHKGGEKGGGAELTKTGKQVVAAYVKLMTKVNNVIRKEQSLLKLI